MEIPENVTGRFVISRAGHDKGNVYVCLAADERGLVLADGESKKLAAPKRKNRRHIQLTNASLTRELADRLRSGKVRDEELARELRLYRKSLEISDRK